MFTVPVYRLALGYGMIGIIEFPKEYICVSIYIFNAHLLARLYVFAMLATSLIIPKRYRRSGHTPRLPEEIIHYQTETLQTRGDFGAQTTQHKNNCVRMKTPSATKPSAAVERSSPNEARLKSFPGMDQHHCSLNSHAPSETTPPWQKHGAAMGDRRSGSPHWALQ